MCRRSSDPICHRTPINIRGGLGRVQLEFLHRTSARNEAVVRVRTISEAIHSDDLRRVLETLEWRELIIWDREGASVELTEAGAIVARRPPARGPRWGN